MTQHKTTLDVTENLATSLKVECIAAGTNLTEVCRDAGVNRSTVQRWMEAEPKTWIEIRKILKAINERRHSK
jgi:DNA-binding phage protein